MTHVPGTSWSSHACPGTMAQHLAASGCLLRLEGKAGGGQCFLLLASLAGSGCQVGAQWSVAASSVSY